MHSHEDTVSIVKQLRIFQVRGEPVVLDSDLAALYGVETRAFNQAIRRNLHRFPPDFAFQLSAEEWEAFKVTNCDLMGGSWTASQVSSLGLHRTRRDHGGDHSQQRASSRLIN